MSSSFVGARWLSRSTIHRPSSSSSNIVAIVRRPWSKGTSSVTASRFISSSGAACRVRSAPRLCSAVAVSTGVPMHAWAADIAERIIAALSRPEQIETDVVHPVESGNTRSIDLWAWTANPSTIPKRMWLSFTNRAKDPKLAPLLAVESPPEHWQRGVRHPVLFHLEEIHDYTAATIDLEEQEASTIAAGAALSSSARRARGPDGVRDFPITTAARWFHDARQTRREVDRHEDDRRDTTTIAGPPASGRPHCAGRWAALANCTRDDFDDDDEDREERMTMTWSRRYRKDRGRRDGRRGSDGFQRTTTAYLGARLDGTMIAITEIAILATHAGEQGQRHMTTPRRRAPGRRRGLAATAGEIGDRLTLSTTRASSSPRRTPLLCTAVRSKQR